MEPRGRLGAIAQVIRVVDTDVVSFFFECDSRANRYSPHLDGMTLVVSFMGVAELERWALKRGWGTARRSRLGEYLGRFVVRPSTPALCRAEVSYLAERRGRPIGCADAWHPQRRFSRTPPLVTHMGVTTQRLPATIRQPNIGRNPGGRRNRTGGLVRSRGDHAPNEAAKNTARRIRSRRCPPFALRKRPALVESQARRSIFEHAGATDRAGSRPSGWHRDCSAEGRDTFPAEGVLP